MISWYASVTKMFVNKGEQTSRASSLYRDSGFGVKVIKVNVS